MTNPHFYCSLMQWGSRKLDTFWLKVLRVFFPLKMFPMFSYMNIQLSPTFTCKTAFVSLSGKCCCLSHCTQTPKTPMRSLGNKRFSSGLTAVFVLGCVWYSCGTIVGMLTMKFNLGRQLTPNLHHVNTFMCCLWICKATKTNVLAMKQI